MKERHREREREAGTQAKREAGSMYREPDMGFEPRSPGTCPGPKAGAKPLRHPGIPVHGILIGIALNVYIALGNIDIFTILILPIHEHGIFFQQFLDPFIY